MTIPDLNLLIYAYNPNAPGHEASRVWWESALSGDETIGLPWIVILGFLRITTSRKTLTEPFSMAVALEIVKEWLSVPGVQIVHPTSGHFSALAALLVKPHDSHHLVTDAHIATLAGEYEAIVCSHDRDFARYGDIRRFDPLA